MATHQQSQKPDSQVLTSPHSTSFISIGEARLRHCLHDPAMWLFHAMSGMGRICKEWGLMLLPVITMQNSQLEVIAMATGIDRLDRLIADSSNISYYAR